MSGWIRHVSSRGTGPRRADRRPAGGRGASRCASALRSAPGGCDPCVGWSSCCGSPSRTIDPRRRATRERVGERELAGLVDEQDVDRAAAQLLARPQSRPCRPRRRPRWTASAASTSALSLSTAARRMRRRPGRAFGFCPIRTGRSSLLRRLRDLVEQVADDLVAVRGRRRPACRRRDQRRRSSARRCTSCRCPAAPGSGQRRGRARGRAASAASGRLPGRRSGRPAPGRPGRRPAAAGRGPTPIRPVRRRCRRRRPRCPIRSRLSSCSRSGPRPRARATVGVAPRDFGPRWIVIVCALVVDGHRCSPAPSPVRRVGRSCRPRRCSWSCSGNRVA